MIKKIVLGGMIMGVLSSCTSYRIKEVTLQSDQKYWFPQRREFIGGDWVDLSKEGSFTKEWAYNKVKEDKMRKEVNIRIIKLVK